MGIAHRVSSFNRQRKWEHFLALVEPKPGLLDLDVGYTGPRPAARSRTPHHVEGRILRQVRTRSSQNGDPDTYN
jgi:hypothetical protein